METATIATTTIEDLGTDADELDLDAYRLCALILRGADDANDSWACESAWNNGAWVQRALVVHGLAFEHLSIDDQSIANAFSARYQ